PVRGEPPRRRGCVRSHRGAGDRPGRGRDAVLAPGGLAATLAGGPGAAASHRSGGRLWAVDGIDRLPADLVEISTPRGGRRPRGIVAHTSTDLGPAWATTVDGIPVTAPTR